MYRTKILWPENSEEVTSLQLATSTTTSVSVSITYASEATMSNGVPVLANPKTGTFTQNSLSTLKGCYIDLDDAIYFIPSNATVSRASSNGTYVWRASTAQKIINTDLELYSGVEAKNAIRSCKITYESNDGDDLMLGSVCTAMLEAKIVSPGGDLSIRTGAEITVYKVAEDGTENQIGVFTCEQPTRLTANTYKLLAYDNVRKLDVDMTDWLRGLTEWPYAITDFYTMICEECGLTGKWSSWSGITDFMVYQFDVEKAVTGRQLVSWCAEVMGDYCVADADGSLQCQWYRRGYIELFPYDAPDEADATTYYQDSLRYEDFLVEDVGEVLSRPDRDGELWGVGIDKDIANNPYIITGNPIILNHPTYGNTSYVNNSVYTALEKIGERFNFIRYQPFSVTIPEFLPAKVGYFVWLRTGKGVIYAPITYLAWDGQRMTLKCTAKRTRDNADSPDYKSNRELMDYSDQAARKAATEACRGLDNLAIYKMCSDCDTAITPGFYYLSGSTCLHYPSKIPSGGYGVMLVQRRYGEVYQQVRYGDYIAFRRSVRDESNISEIASWKDWIVINLATLASMVATAAVVPEEETT